MLFASLNRIRTVAATIAVLAVALLVGCAAQSRSQPTAKKAGIKLDLWHNQNQPDAQAAFQALIDAFQKANPDVTVKQQIFNWTDVKPKVTAALAVGTPPDILHVAPDYLVALKETGKIKPVDDIVKAIDQKYHFLGVQLTPYQSGGHTYAVPAFALVQMLYYRKDLLKKAGLRPPRTWADFLRVAKALTKNGQYGIGLPLSNSMYTDQVLYQFILTAGGDIYDAKGNITFNTPQVKAALGVIKQLAAYTPPGSTNWVWEDANNALAQGKIAMTFQFGLIPSWYDSQNPKNKGAIGAVPPPVGPRGDRGATAYSNGFAVFDRGDPARRAAIKKFLLFMASTQANAKFLCSMSPGLLLPVLQATGKSSAYFNCPGIKTYGEVVRAELTALKYGKLFGFTHGKVPKSVGPISSSYILGATVQRMILKHMSPAAAAAWGQDQMNKLARRGK